MKLLSPSLLFVYLFTRFVCDGMMLQCCNIKERDEDNDHDENGRSNSNKSKLSRALPSGSSFRLVKW